MSLCMLAASICMFLYSMDDCVCEEGGLGGRSEITEPLYWDMSLCFPLLCRLGTATCPNCKQDEGIKELEFGCDCKEEISALAACLQHLGCAHPDINNRDIMENQTLVDWLVVSGEIHFELGWGSKDEMKGGGEAQGEGKRMGGRGERQEENRKYEGGGHNKASGHWTTNLFKLFNITYVRKYWSTACCIDITVSMDSVCAVLTRCIFLRFHIKEVRLVVSSPLHRISSAVRDSLKHKQMK